MPWNILNCIRVVNVEGSWCQTFLENSVRPLSPGGGGGMGVVGLGLGARMPVVLGGVRSSDSVTGFGAASTASTSVMLAELGSSSTGIVWTSS